MGSTKEKWLKHFAHSWPVSLKQRYCRQWVTKLEQSSDLWFWSETKRDYLGKLDFRNLPIIFLSDHDGPNWKTMIDWQQVVLGNQLSPNEFFGANWQLGPLKLLCFTILFLAWHNLQCDFCLVTWSSQHHKSQNAAIRWLFNPKGARLFFSQR